MTRFAQQSRIDAAVMAEIDRYMKRGGWAAPADSLNPLQHARAHRAAMSAERRAELDREWEA